MTPKQAAEILRKFNAWRRYDGPHEITPTCPEPKDIGEAIDVACEMLESYVKAHVIESANPATMEGEPFQHLITILYEENNDNYAIAGDDILVSIKQK